MASNVPQKNRPSQIAAEQKLADGLTKHATTITSIVIAGATMTAKDILATLQALIDSANAVQSTKATWQNTIKTDDAERTKLASFLAGLRQSILAAFAGQIDTLADFGLSPRQVVVRTPEEKIVSAAKAQATRAARHTLGKVEKAAIKGTVPTTVTATATSTPTATATATATPTTTATTTATTTTTTTAIVAAPVPSHQS